MLVEKEGGREGQQQQQQQQQQQSNGSGAAAGGASGASLAAEVAALRQELMAETAAAGPQHEARLLALLQVGGLRTTGFAGGWVYLCVSCFP